MEAVWEHDSNKIVIDEVAGMMITLAFLPYELVYYFDWLCVVSLF